MCTTPQRRAPSGFFKYDIFKTSWYKTLKECERKVENFTTQAEKSMKNQRFRSTARIFSQKREKLNFFTQVFRCGKALNLSCRTSKRRFSTKTERQQIWIYQRVFGKDFTAFARLFKMCGKSLATFSLQEGAAKKKLAKRNGVKAFRPLRRATRAPRP